MKLYKRLISAVIAASMALAGSAININLVSAAPSISGGWNETLYAEWADSDPDSEAVVVGYKLSTEDSYHYLEGDDLKYLVRKATTSGYGRVDIPGIKAGRYDLYIKASDGTEHTRKGIKVYAYDRSGYAHFNNESGVGAYNDDGTPKDNAIIVYVTDENKDTVEVPGYEGHEPVAYMSSTSGATWTRDTAGIGNILNNNHKYIREITGTDNHPIIFRFIGEVTVPQNLTPYDTKTNELGGSKGDNGNLAITKYAKNITIEGIGEDAVINGWGFTFSQTSTCPSDTGENFEVRNLTFKNYTEDALGFQGDDAITSPIQRVWVHNNVFYPGYCANPAESDKADGDGSCDFKRGNYYTMSYNHYIECHKTNLLGASGSNYQYNMSLHHNWYERVAARQPLGASGNAHIYNTYFDNSTGTTIDLRGTTSYFLENNYLENCKESYKSRNATSNMKIYNDIVVDSGVKGGSKETIKGTKTVVENREDSGLPDNGLTLPTGENAKDFDTNSSVFYYDSANKKSDVEVLNATEDVPEYVKTYAGTLKAFPETESGEIVVNVKSGSTAITDATVSANGLTFKNNGNGKYTATASLGAEYSIKVSKEGYSNKILSPRIINDDGDVVELEANLEVDYDGYAIVKLVGGSEGSAVKGATVTLADGTVLADQGDGTYKSDSEIKTGTYKATITNTGDYIAPESAVDVVVKTTDEPTEISLDMVKGSVKVNVKAADGETKTPDLSGAKVYAGSTLLDNNGDGTFTGEVDINTPLSITVILTGWNVSSVTPSAITAAKDSVAEATAELVSRGELFTWNDTEDINTDNFFVFASEPTEWSSASKNAQVYDDETLTAAIKVQSSTKITFEAPSDGTLVLVMEAKSGSTVKVNGTAYDVTTGTNKISVSAGTNTIEKGKNETHLFLLQFTTGDVVDTPVIGTTTTTTTTTTTEATTEVTTLATPVDKGEAVVNSGDGISVTHNDSTGVWTLSDTSSTLAATLDIPFEAISSGKVVISGTATPSAASGKWAFINVKGVSASSTDDTVSEILAFASDSNKNLALRVNGATYVSTSTAIEANKTYSYEFVIDLDNKTAELTIDGTTLSSSIDVSSISSVGAVTAVSASRNVTLTDPYVAVVTESVEEPEPEPTDTLTDDIMWSVDSDLTSSGWLTVGTTFVADEEETARTFTDGGKSYDMSNYVQAPNGGNPVNASGVNPQSATTSDRIPVSGGFVKLTPEENGVFTVAAKTNGGKITYITDETGEVIQTIGSDESATSYDVIRIPVKAGKSYYVYSGGSRICIFYLGFTGDGTPIEPIEPVEPVDIYTVGDVDNNGKVEAADASMLLQRVLKNVKTTIEEATDEFMKYIDVDGDGTLTSADVAHILQKSLDSGYTLPIEK